MANRKNKTLGILGGMGPEATVYLYQLIIKHTPASKDQDHIPTIIYSNTLIPDRTESIFKESHEEIVKILSESAKKLEKAGVDFIVIPCNTAHFYIEAIQKDIKIPILDMIKISANYLQEKFLKQKEINQRVGLLATSGTVQSRIYQKRFQSEKIEVVTLNKPDQYKVMEIIYDIKKSGPSKSFKKRVKKLIRKLKREKGVNWIVLGCTEISLLFQDDPDIEGKFLLDPMEILAKYVVKKVKGKFI